MAPPSDLEVVDLVGIDVRNHGEGSDEVVSTVHKGSVPHILVSIGDNRDSLVNVVEAILIIEGQAQVVLVDGIEDVLYHLGETLVSVVEGGQWLLLIASSGSHGSWDGHRGWRARRSLLYVRSSDSLHG